MPVEFARQALENSRQAQDHRRNWLPSSLRGSGHVVASEVLTN